MKPFHKIKNVAFNNLSGKTRKILRLNYDSINVFFFKCIHPILIQGLNLIILTLDLFDRFYNYSIRNNNLFNYYSICITITITYF